MVSEPPALAGGPIAFLSEPPALAGGPSLKGCQIVAGGRSGAQTTGTKRTVRQNLGGVPPFSATLLEVENRFRLSSGGLRFASTIGYYPTAFQAEMLSLRFHTLSC